MLMEINNSENSRFKLLWPDLVLQPINLPAIGPVPIKDESRKIIEYYKSLDTEVCTNS